MSNSASVACQPAAARCKSLVVVVSRELHANGIDGVSVGGWYCAETITVTIKV